MYMEKALCFEDEEIRAITATQQIIKDICGEFNEGKCPRCPFDGICGQMKEVFDEFITNGKYILDV